MTGYQACTRQASIRQQGSLHAVATLPVFSAVVARPFRLSRRYPTLVFVSESVIALITGMSSPRQKRTQALLIRRCAAGRHMISSPWSGAADR